MSGAEVVDRQQNEGVERGCHGKLLCVLECTGEEIDFVLGGGDGVARRGEE